MVTPVTDEPSRTRSAFKASAWPAGAACIGFFAVSVLLFRAYGLLHWDIISRNRNSLPEPVKSDLFRLLSRLEVYHLTALFSLGFGVWAFRGEPYWLRWACLPLAVI